MEFQVTVPVFLAALTVHRLGVQVGPGPLSTAQRSESVTVAPYSDSDSRRRGTGSLRDGTATADVPGAAACNNYTLAVTAVRREQTVTKQFSAE